MNTNAIGVGRIALLGVGVAFIFGIMTSSAQAYYDGDAYGSYDSCISEYLCYDAGWSVTSGYPSFVTTGVPGGPQTSHYPSHPNYLGQWDYLMGNDFAPTATYPSNVPYGGYSGGSAYGNPYQMQQPQNHGYRAPVQQPQMGNPYLNSHNPFNQNINANLNSNTVTNRNNNTISNSINVGGYMQPAYSAPAYVAPTYAAPSYAPSYSPVVPVQRGGVPYFTIAHQLNEGKSVQAPVQNGQVALSQIPYTGVTMGPLGYALYLLSVVAVAIVAAFALATRYDVSRFFSGNLSVRNNTPASAVAERTPANPASGDSMSFLKVQGEAPRIIINRG